ncbi:DNA-binding transcriptional regulator, LysR family [Flavobacterium succinicans]|jgi:DNA-binding transcriptional LysR family regulator|uniref:DNA-binding transcriptional regulator, LysR family n=1 Tax=Flavobacterium succinicans TaxID=29536 RepID=A0A1I4WAM1_9FLAO|nr:LysR family transcriptional regulator [Flavobacterium succinicans]SFN10246.1 DNA-binding transcriptional regulator, LysR family [Flavobacterium succinicans]
MDFRLKVFFTVATRLNFTKAAAELYISQPAVSKHIHELEETYNTKLFERNGSKIALTPAGHLLLKHTKAIFDIYRNIEFDMSTFVSQRKGLLRLGASTTISQYVIPPVLAQFHQRETDISIQLTNGNTEQIETALLQKEIEIGIVEGQSKNQSIKYVPFLKDELVLVCHSKHPLAKQNEISIEDLKTLRLLTRERGSGTLEVITYALRKHNIQLSDLQIEMELGSTESIKSYLLHSECLAFMSIFSIESELKSGELSIVDIQGLSFERDIYVITLMGKSDTLATLFIQSLFKYYNLEL